LQTAQTIEIFAGCWKADKCNRLGSVGGLLKYLNAELRLVTAGWMPAAKPYHPSPKPRPGAGPVVSSTACTFAGRVVRGRSPLFDTFYRQPPVLGNFNTEQKSLSRWILLSFAGIRALWEEKEEFITSFDRRGKHCAKLSEVNKARKHPSQMYCTSFLATSCFAFSSRPRRATRVTREVWSDPCSCQYRSKGTTNPMSLRVESRHAIQPLPISVRNERHHHPARNYRHRCGRVGFLFRESAA
jgi:hypothetical protein